MSTMQDLKKAQKFFNKKNNKTGSTKTNSISKQSSAPIANPNKQKQKTANIQKDKNVMLVNHSEFIQDLTGTGPAFIVKKFAVNPGMNQTFPWLSSIANRFQKYRFRKLAFRYETSAPSTQSGYVMIVPDFDASDQIPTNKQQALQFQSSVRSNVWERILLQVRDKDLHAEEQYYVRSGDIPNTDIKTYDVAQLFTVMVGPGAELGAIGELWVDYEVELISPYISNISADFQSGILQGSLINFDMGFNVLPVTGSTNLAFHISDSKRLMIFDQYFKGLITIFGNQSGPGPYDMAISGPNTNALYVALKSSSVTPNSQSITACYVIEIQQGGYLAFDGWCPSGSADCYVWYAFTPAIGF